MRQWAVLLGAILITALGAGAQEVSLSSPPEVSAPSAADQTALPDATQLFAIANFPATAAPKPLFSAFPAMAEPSEPAAQQPGVYGVFTHYKWQLYAGYSFFRFYIASKPSTREHMNGLDLGVVYFVHGDRFGLEGQFVGEYGSFIANSSQFALGMGGLRYRWQGDREAEWWLHGLFGGAKFLPQTAFGSQGALVYELGGGADLGSHRSRLSYRFEADMVGTRFFSTYQFSPRVSAGIVFKFGPPQ
jgi:hypothetical protein